MKGKNNGSILAVMAKAPKAKSVKTTRAPTVQSAKGTKRALLVSDDNEPLRVSEGACCHVCANCIKNGVLHSVFTYTKAFMNSHLFSINTGSEGKEERRSS